MRGFRSIRIQNQPIPTVSNLQAQEKEDKIAFEPAKRSAPIAKALGCKWSNRLRTDCLGIESFDMTCFYIPPDLECFYPIPFSAVMTTSTSPIGFTTLHYFDVMWSPMKVVFADELLNPYDKSWMNSFHGHLRSADRTIEIRCLGAEKINLWRDCAIWSFLFWMLAHVSEFRRPCSVFGRVVAHASGIRALF